MTAGERVVVGAVGGALIAVGAALLVRALAGRDRVEPAASRPAPPPRPGSESDSALDTALEATFPASDPVVAWSG